jgi:hypothetical protein
MYVIGGAVDDDRGSAHFVDDATQIREKVSAEVGLDQREALFGSEDQMEHDVTAGFWHGFFRPFRACAWASFNPVLTPWTAFLRRFAAFECRSTEQLSP